MEIVASVAFVNVVVLAMFLLRGYGPWSKGRQSNSSNQVWREAMWKESKKSLVKMDYHRNGISGLGFHVAIVDETEGDETRRMLVVRFNKRADEETGNVVCAAFDLAKLDQRIIEFGLNSWRGDHYSDFMDAEIGKDNKRFSE